MSVTSPRARITVALVVGALGWACNGPIKGSSPTSVSPNPTNSTSSLASASKSSGHCGDVVGAWSPVVNGLRGRLVTTGSRADLSALEITLELENVSGGALEMSWSGASLGFATFRLEDESGTAVPKPSWALGGNEAVGSFREVLPVGVARHEVSTTFGRMMGDRILRIGAFWGYPMPSDGSRRLLRASVTGTAPRDDAGWTEVVHPAVGDAGASVRAGPPGDPRGKAWIGTLEIPAVCIE